MSSGSFCSSCQTANAVVEDAEAGGSVCTVCGTISQDASSSLVVLGKVSEDGLEFGRNYIHNGGTQYVGARPTLNGRAVAGLNRTIDYHKHRQAESEKFIRSLLHAIQLSPLQERAKRLFNEAKRKIKFRWGDKAKVIATACVYIASRERDAALRLCELASIAEIDVLVLTRAQSAVKLWLHIRAPEHEPIVFLEQLIVHMFDLLSSSPDPPLSGYKRPTWSPACLKFLRSFKLADVHALATSLLDFASAVGLLLGRSPEQGAVAAVVMAMEGTARTVAPHAVEIMTEFGHLLGLSGTFTTAERYREFVKMLGDYAPKIPWLGFKAGVQVQKKDLIRDTQDIVTFGRALALKEQMEKAEPEADTGKGKGKSKVVRNSTLEERPDDNEGSPGAEDEDEDDEDEDSEDGADKADLLLDQTFNKPSNIPASARAARSPSMSSSPAAETDSPHDGAARPVKPVHPDEKVPRAGRPLEYMRLRPGADKRARTIELAAASIEQAAAPLFSAFGIPTPPVPPQSSTQSLSNPVPSMSSVIAPGYRHTRPQNARPFAAHETEAVRIRQQLLMGHDRADIFQRRVETVQSANSNRLTKLLWNREVDEIDDDELFGEGELEALVRTDEEVEILRRSAKFLEMPYVEYVEPKTVRNKKKRTRPVQVIDENGKVTLEMEGEEDKRENGDTDSGRPKKKSKFTAELADRMARLFAGQLDDDIDSNEVAREMDPHLAQAFAGGDLELAEEESGDESRQYGRNDWSWSL